MRPRSMHRNVLRSRKVVETRARPRPRGCEMAEGRFEIFRRARRWPLRQRWLGQSAAAGGVVWLVALAVLVATDNIENVAVRILFGVAGMLGGLGLWRLSSLFSARSARVGC